MRWEQPLATIILGIGGILLAIAGIVQHVSTLLNDAGDVIIPFTFVMLVDWIYVQRRRTAVQVFFEQPQGRAGRIVPSAIAAVLVGFIIGYWGNHFLPGFFYNTLPLPVVGGVVAAVAGGEGERTECEEKNSGSKSRSGNTHARLLLPIIRICG